MTPTPESRLLELYDRVAEAPGATDRLRKFVLDLAVRGKLVEQNPEDEPAEVLLGRIAAEKARLVKAGEIRKPRALPPIDNAPFDLPSKWRWVRLSDILIKLTDGTHHSPPNGPEGEFLYITAKNIKDDGVKLDNVTYVSRAVHEEIYARCNPEPGDILYIKDGATTGVVAVNNLDQPFSMLSSVALLKLPECISNHLLVVLLRSPFFYDQMRGFMKGAAIPRVTLKRMAPALLPLPPIGEQHRIVAKVDELMALLDRLETTRTQRETTRNRLTTASLTRLTAPETTEKQFRTHARFALDNFDQLTNRPEQIKVLRQTILDLAVRGKLVEQNPADDPASTILKRVAEKKERLGLKRAVWGQEDKAPFELPTGWSWTCVGEICSKTGSGSTPRGGKSVYKNSGIPFLRSQNVYNDGLRLHDVAYIDPKIHEGMKGTRVLAGDLLLNITGGSIGRCCRVPEDFGDGNVSQHVAIIRPALRGMERFLHCLIQSPYFQAFIFDEQTGAGRGGLPKNRMDRIAVALPPLSEQHRIVTKVDSLMAACDCLDVALATTGNNRIQLLECLLHEALTSDTQNKEAA